MSGVNKCWMCGKIIKDIVNKNLDGQNVKLCSECETFGVTKEEVENENNF